MYPLVESICIRDGIPQHLNYHQERVNRTCNALFQGETPPLLLNSISVPSHLLQGLIKCRVIYGPHITEITFSPYPPKKIQTLRIVRTTGVSYPWKYVVRPELDNLFAQKQAADEIIIINDGLITDAYYYNIAVLIRDQWLTPATPLLTGTCRQRLLVKGYLQEATLTESDLPNITCWQLINAMTPEETLTFDPSQIIGC